MTKDAVTTKAEMEGDLESQGSGAQKQEESGAQKSVEMKLKTIKVTECSEPYFRRVCSDFSKMESQKRFEEQAPGDLHCARNLEKELEDIERNRAIIVRKKCSTLKKEEWPKTWEGHLQLKEKLKQHKISLMGENNNETALRLRRHIEYEYHKNQLAQERLHDKYGDIPPISSHDFKIVMQKLEHLGMKRKTALYGDKLDQFFNPYSRYTVNALCVCKPTFPAIWNNKNSSPAMALGSENYKLYNPKTASIACSDFIPDCLDQSKQTQANPGVYEPIDLCCTLYIDATKTGMIAGYNTSLKMAMKSHSESDFICFDLECQNGAKMLHNKYDFAKEGNEAFLVKQIDCVEGKKQESKSHVRSETEAIIHYDVPDIAAVGVEYPVESFELLQAIKCVNMVDYDKELLKTCPRGGIYRTEDGDHLLEKIPLKCDEQFRTSQPTQIIILDHEYRKLYSVNPSDFMDHSSHASKDSSKTLTIAAIEPYAKDINGYIEKKRRELDAQAQTNTGAHQQNADAGHEASSSTPEKPQTPKDVLDFFSNLGEQESLPETSSPKGLILKESKPSNRAPHSILDRSVAERLRDVLCLK